ncbi:hypothetical protein K438DRAFT_1961792 [Mycena galopus ATCC 62051]|nr:hypothetical protein K438DRAFT_1961792 [Mycena galopus ATCC 62051]
MQSRTENPVVRPPSSLSLRAHQPLDLFYNVLLRPAKQRPEYPELADDVCFDRALAPRAYRRHDQLHRDPRLVLARRQRVEEHRVLVHVVPTAFALRLQHEPLQPANSSSPHMPIQLARRASIYAAGTSYRKRSSTPGCEEAGALLGGSRMVYGPVPGAEADGRDLGSAGDEQGTRRVDRDGGQLVQRLADDMDGVSG